jgi:hypothetical protein
MMALNPHATWMSDGEPSRHQRRCFSQLEMLDLGHELKRAASSITISKAAPYALAEIDRELLRVRAFVNGAATAQLRPDGLELGVETIVSNDECERGRAADVIEI